MNKQLLTLSSLVLISILFTSCSDNDDPQPKYDTSNVFTSAFYEYGVNKNKHNFLIDFTSSCRDELEVINKTEWLDNVAFYDKSSSIFANIAAYNGDYCRTGEILVRTKDKKFSKTIKIIQEGKNGFCSGDNHPHAIDLGTGVKWACCNVGTLVPGEYGRYYAWGEYEVKNIYNESTYKYLNEEGQFADIGEDIAGSYYDVAQLLWSGKWKMPSYSQFDALANECFSEWIDQKGVYGRRFTGRNGMYIFFPAAGYRWDSDINKIGEYGCYWSSSSFPNNSNGAYYFFFNNSEAACKNISRSYGHSIRPVID